MISLVGVSRRLKCTLRSNSYRCRARMGGMNVGEVVRHIGTTSKRLVNPKTSQFLVNYPFLVLIPSSLQLNLSFIVSKNQITHLPWKKDIDCDR